MTFSLTAFPCLAASTRGGIGRGLLNGAGSPIPCRAQMKALEANAPQPMAKLRRVRIMRLEAICTISLSGRQSVAALILGDRPYYRASEQFAKPLANLVFGKMVEGLLALFLSPRNRSVSSRAACGRYMVMRQKVRPSAGHAGHYN